MVEKSLRNIRKRIDDIDAEIVRLLDIRAAAGREAGELKKNLGQPIRNPERELEILARAVSLSDGSMPKHALNAIYRSIIKETLAQESDEGRCAPDAARRSDPSAKRDLTAEIVENKQVAPGFRRMRLYIPSMGDIFLPGQFFQLRLERSDTGFFLRRPFAPSAADSDGLTFVYAVIGEGTRHLAALELGRKVSILAPLGNAFSLPDSGGKALLIGGGCGAPSLATLASALKARGVYTTTIIGARTAEALLEQHTFAKAADHLIIATDDGSRGCQGTALDAYKLEKRAGKDDFDRIYACGPHPMLRAAARLAEEENIPCEVSLEERMACGFGACMGCAVPVKDAKADGGIAYRRVCHEGPVFDSRKLVWDLMR